MPIKLQTPRKAKPVVKKSLTVGKKLLPTEHEEQATVVRWWDATHSRDAADLFAIPNGAHLAGGIGQRSAKVNILKAEGMRPGTPDLFLGIPNAHYHGLYIEMKREKGSVVSPEQKQRINEKRRRGYMAVICKGATAAIDVIRNYMKTALPKVDCELLE